jgi:beta-barrel assembly-enhancing protease
MWRLAGLAIIGGFAIGGLAQIKDLKPGWNLFSPQQDVQLGHEAAAQVEKTQPVLHDQKINGYLTVIGQKLAKSPHSGNWPFSFTAINDKNINAFALPGGPMFINTATISAADNEAQLAGVMAHEMSHVVLRHGTHEISKQQALRLPLILGSSVMGNGILGSLGRLGINLGANSVILHFSREAEAQADYNGALIMSDVGYNPIEMARFFEKLQSKGSEGAIAQFLSDHPTPGNRVKAVETEIQYLPQRDYRDDITGQLPSVKAEVQRLPPPPRRPQPAGSN